MFNIIKILKLFIHKMFKRNSIAVYKKGDFSIIKDTYSQHMLEDAYNVIEKKKLWNFIKHNSPQEGTGYMFWNNDKMISIINDLKFGHTNHSLEFVMEHMKLIAKYDWTHYIHYIAVFYKEYHV